MSSQEGEHNQGQQLRDQQPQGPCMPAADDGGGSQLYYINFFISFCDLKL